MPREVIREHFGPLVPRAPSLEDSGVDVHDPQLVGWRTQVEVAFEAAVEPRRVWRQDLYREHQLLDDGPIAHHDAGWRNPIHEEVGLDERAGLDLDVGRRRQQLTESLAPHVWRQAVPQQRERALV